MWTTTAHAAIAHEVMRLRGFTYKSQVAWDKEIPGTGHWFINQHEILLVGTRGNVPAPAPGTQWSSVIRERKREHSRKPEQSYQMIEAYFPNVPKIELNCRGKCRMGCVNEVEEAADEASPSPASGRRDFNLRFWKPAFTVTVDFCRRHAGRSLH
jgi:N6-adenosine-specific RNA methylase IME4